MSLWTWLRDFADRRSGGSKSSVRNDPAPASIPLEIPKVPNADDLLADLYEGLGLGGVTRTIRTTLEVTTKCATCGARNRVDMGRPGSVRCGACGLPLRVTITK